MRPLAASASRHSADLAGRSVALSAEIPAGFDAPLGPHHRLIGRWAAAQGVSRRTCTRAEARREIERAFNAAVLDILGPIELADLRTVVLHGEGVRPPAIAVICETMGQVDLGWIETSDAPIAWRAAAYQALEQCLGLVLPVFCYHDLFEEIAMYYWDGDTDDEAARQTLIHNYGAQGDDLDGMPLPSEMNARRPEWMNEANAAPAQHLPAGLAQALDTLRAAHKAVKDVPADRSAWHFDFEMACEYMPGIEECSSLPSLTLVPFEQFARELDDVARNGMEMGFMDFAGICPLPDAARVGDWFSSLRLGARFLLAAQALVELDPAKL